MQSALVHLILCGCRTFVFMHQYQSTSSIRRLRLAAVLMCARCWLLLASVGVLIWSLISCDLELAIIGIGLIALTALAGVLQWLAAAQTHCPLCRTTILAGSGCAKHRRARRFLGSYRLPVALSIVFRKSFVCPYCHEQTSLEVRRHDRDPAGQLRGRTK